jgi:hypothetical protein
MPQQYGEPKVNILVEGESNHFCTGCGKMMIGACVPPEQEPERIRPVRPPDIELFVEGSPHPTFVSKLPALEYLEHFIEAMPDEYYPRSWWVARIDFEARI